MKVNEKGELVIDFSEIAESMTDEQKTILAHHVAWDDILFEMIVSRLFDFHPWVWDGWSAYPDRVAQKLREKIIEGVGGPIAQTCMRRLMQERDEAKTDAKLKDEWAWKLYQSWPRPENDYRPAPAPPKWAPTPTPTAADADAELAKG